MRRRIATLAAVSALALALSASPALAGSPAIHSPFDPVGIVVNCGANDYTVVSGYLSGVFHSNDDFASFHEADTARNLMVQKNDGAGIPSGPTYRVVGGQTQGITINDQTGSVRGTATFKYQILGTGDSINIVLHIYGPGPNDFYEVNHGTCALPRG